MLTNAAVNAARALPRAYKIWDHNGLHLFVTPNGTKRWRCRFRKAGRETMVSLGEHPTMTLTAARIANETAREQMRRGDDPRALANMHACDHANMHFEDAARAWHELQLARWSPAHAADVLASLERDVFPAIGAKRLDEIDPRTILRALRAVEARGRLETARRLRQRISMIFALAVSEGWAVSDPAEIVGRALLPPAPARRQLALLELDHLQQLLAAADAAPAPAIVKLASHFLALTAVRLAAVRGARWSEFEDLDGPAPLWRVPAARMKLARAKKALAENDHLVPLSPAAVAVLRAARPTHHKQIATDLVFPGRLPGRPIGEGAIGDLYDLAGYAGRHVPHGWRASFSTLVNARFRGDGDRAAIDRALGHAPKDKIEAAYNRGEDLIRRRDYFDAWGEMLTAPGI